MRVAEVAGRKFGQLLITNEFVIERKAEKQTVRKWLCKCDCGNTCYVETNRLVSGHTKSCGCLRSTFKKKSPGEAALNMVFDDYVRGALKRNYTFELSRQEFDELIVKPCVYCGSVKETLRKTRSGDLVAITGIDRKDNSLGYTVKNSFPCCSTCNRLKSDLTEEKFINQVSNIAKRLNLC